MQRVMKCGHGCSIVLKPKMLREDKVEAAASSTKNAKRAKTISQSNRNHQSTKVYKYKTEREFASISSLFLFFRGLGTSPAVAEKYRHAPARISSTLSAQLRRGFIHGEGSISQPARAECRSRAEPRAEVRVRLNNCSVSQTRSYEHGGILFQLFSPS